MQSVDYQIQLLGYHTSRMRINEDIWPAGGKVFKALTIAGSDSGGCAGIQADLRAFAALGVHGLTAITSVTAQNTRQVLEVCNLSGRMVSSQIDAVMNDIGADAAKTGMLAAPEIIEAAADGVLRHGINRLVVDPVMVSTGGDELVSKEAAAIMVGKLFPLAMVITPNLDEASFLTGSPIRTLQDMKTASSRLLESGAGAVLVKGGHLEDSPESIDLFYDGESYLEFRSPRLETSNTHGSGCTLAAAIAALLAKGNGLAEAVGMAKQYVTGAIRNSYSLGKGNGPLGHFFID